MRLVGLCTMYALLLAKDADEAALLSLALQRVGLAVTASADLERAMHIWAERPADLIVLALPHAAPVTQAQRVRQETSAALLMVVDPLDEATHCALLENGADLVVMRPFSARLLISQARALLRRTGGVPVFSMPTLALDGVTLDPATRTVQVDERPPRRLTHLEFRLLYTLMLHRGQVLPLETIVERVWGYTGEGDRELVRGLISRLRNKVETDPRTPRHIRNVPGVGYAFGKANTPP